MTAWTPVSEAAALLGVSERTIWRRIKSEAIDSRSENGRTLVKLEHDEEADGPLRQMSSVAAAQLSMRRLDVDGLNDVLSMVRDYRATLELGARRTRRSARIWAALAIAAMAGLVAGGWLFVNHARQTEQTHAAVLADLRVRHANELAEQNAQNEHGSILAADRGKQLEHLHRLTAEQRAELNQVATSRKQFAEMIDTRLGEMTRVASTDKAILVDRDKQVADLRGQIASLEERITRMDDSARRVRGLERKYTEAVRRAASHSRGLAKGLQIHLAYQKEIERQLRRELALASANDGPLAKAGVNADASDADMRRELLDALINQPSPPRPFESGIDEPVVGWRLIWRHLEDAFWDKPKPRDAPQSRDTEIVLVD